MTEDAGLTPLPFAVVDVSSEEIGYEASALTSYFPDAVGWQSDKEHSSDFHKLVLKIQHDDERRFIHALEILCHESKIAEKIEISLGSFQGDAPSTFDECETICHLGYITLDSNEISRFQSREQKRVPIEKQADFVQLVLRGCIKNPHNKHNQVGIAGIRVMGKLNNKTIHSDNRLPVPKIEIPSATQGSSLLSCLKNDLDPKTQSTLDRLERLKKERALSEDFEMAGKIKESLSSVYSLLFAFKDCEKSMHQSAASEDYASASRLKSERDIKRVQAALALDEVERQFIGRIDEIVGEPVLEDSRCTSPKKLSPQNTNLDGRSTASHTKIAREEEWSALGGDHPLLGVENAEELPAPEEITDSGISSDIVQKCEELLGRYRTKCFFSKNWMLREAALAKITLLVPDICKTNDDFAELICSIIEVGIDDKNLQVYLAALVLLDEMILQFESFKPSQERIAALVSRIVSNLLNKLADSKQKIVDSAELALLCMASSCYIDNSSVVKAATRRIRSKESKSGRTIKARLCFLDNLAAEFADGVDWKRIANFVLTYRSFDHKEEGLRDAAKSLVVTLMAVHGEEVILKYIKDCDVVPDKQLNELRSRFAAIKQGQPYNR